MGGRPYHGAGAGSSSYYSSASTPSAPTNVQMLQEGQTYANESHNTEPVGTIPAAPNSATVGWKSSPGAASYNILDNGVVVANVSVASAASGYSTYVSGQTSGGGAIQTNCDCAYQYNSATDILSYSYLTPNQYAAYPDGQVDGPNAEGIYFPNSPHLFQVQAVAANSATSAISDYANAILFANGLALFYNGQFNGLTVNVADTTCPVPSPMGYTTNYLWTCNTANQLVIPFTGSSCPDYALNVNGWGYLNLSVCPAQSGSTLACAALITGDYFLTAPGTTWDIDTYGGPSSPPANQWTQYRFPLSEVMLNTQGTIEAVQQAFYKLVIQSHNTGGSTETFWLEFSFSVD